MMMIKRVESIFTRALAVVKLPARRRIRLTWWSLFLWTHGKKCFCKEFYLQKFITKLTNCLILACTNLEWVYSRDVEEIHWSLISNWMNLYCSYWKLIAKVYSNLSSFNSYLSSFNSNLSILTLNLSSFKLIVGGSIWIFRNSVQIFEASIRIL